MSRQAEENLVTAEILCALVSISTASSGCAQERQTDRPIVGFIGSVLAVSQQSHAEGATLVSQIDPLMRSNFELSLFFIRPLNRADIPVVRRQIVRASQLQACLKVRFFSFPIDYIAEFDAIPGIARGQTDPLHEPRTFALALDFDGYSRRPALNHASPGGARNETARRPLDVFEVHVPGRPLSRIISRDCQ